MQIPDQKAFTLIVHIRSLSKLVILKQRTSKRPDLRRDAKSRRRIQNDGKCPCPSNRTIGVGEIGREPHGISWLQKHFLTDWPQAEISRETVQELQCAR